MFRPSPGRHSHGLCPDLTATTRFVAGEQVRARHVAQTTFGVVRKAIGGYYEERWYSHGAYIVENGQGAMTMLKSDAVWDPQQEGT